MHFAQYLKYSNGVTYVFALFDILRASKYLLIALVMIVGLVLPPRFSSSVLLITPYSCKYLYVSSLANYSLTKFD